MAPITCKVVDANNRGRPGVYVVLECKDQLHRGIATLESLTDEDGGISLWFPTPSPGRTDDVEPQIVDSSNIPRVSLTFFPHTVPSTCPGPFLSIHTDFCEHARAAARPVNPLPVAAASTSQPEQPTIADASEWYALPQWESGSETEGGRLSAITKQEALIRVAEVGQGDS
ncbi:hypothetical protein H633G_11618 [Metarhizium anisopliae BRIP 53284]|nr:hypothetical protein H633G_11618 [Metarhizium anisopliae BRIP 53284]